MSETEQHLEHAEHAQHAAHSPFDRRVTMTIAIIAALLACVTLLSHRAHNATLQSEIHANDFITLASDKWNEYQAKKNRLYLFQVNIELVRVLSKDGTQNSDEQTKAWKTQAEKFEEDAAKLQNEARDYEDKAKEMKDQSEHIHHIGDRYDLGELGVEIGLVICSIAVLTKRNGFWLSGMAAAGLGAVLAVIGVCQQYLVHYH